MSRTKKITDWCNLHNNKVWYLLLEIGAFDVNHRSHPSQHTHKPPLSSPHFGQIASSDSTDALESSSKAKSAMISLDSRSFPLLDVSFYSPFSFWSSFLPSLASFVQFPTVSLLFSAFCLISSPPSPSRSELYHVQFLQYFIFSNTHSFAFQSRLAFLFCPSSWAR